MSIYGGLVNVIPIENYFDKKNENSATSTMLETINKIKFPKLKNEESNMFILFGSYALKIQPYFGDFDTLNFVKLTGNRKEVLPKIVKGIQQIVKNVQKMPNHFITDIKAGRYKDSESIHWSPEEILKGYRDEGIPDFNGHIGPFITLKDAINQDNQKGKGNPLLKIDMICPYYDKFIEATSIYCISCNDWRFYADNFADKKRIIYSIMQDGEKQYKKGRYFKVIKRLYASIRMTRTLFGLDESFKIVKPIIPLVNSNLSKLSLIASDLNTIKLLLDLNKKINIPFTCREVQQMKDRASNFLDIKFKNKYFDSIIDNLTKALYNLDFKKSNNLIEELTEYIQETIKIEIDEFFTSRNTTLHDYISFVYKYLDTYLKKL